MLKIALSTSVVALVLIFHGCLITAAPQFQSQQTITASDSNRKTVIVSMRETARSVLDGLATRNFASQRERFNAEYGALRALATRSQKNVVELLNREKRSDPQISYTSLWITNQVVVRNAPNSLIQTLKSRFPEVSKVEDEKKLQLQSNNNNNSANQRRG